MKKTAAICLLCIFFVAHVRCQTLEYVKQIPVSLDDPETYIRDIQIDTSGTLFYTQYLGSTTHKIMKISDPLGVATAEEFSTVTLPRSDNGNCLCLDDQGCIYVTSQNNKTITKFDSSGALVTDFGENGVYTCTLVPRHINFMTTSDGLSRLIVSAYRKAETSPYLYQLDAQTGRIIDSMVSKADPGDHGTSAGMKADLYGSHVYLPNEDALLANAHCDLIKVSFTPSHELLAASTDILKYHGNYGGVIHGLAYNDKLNIVAYSGGISGQKPSTSYGMMIWLCNLTTGAEIPYFPSLDTTSPDYFGKVFGAMQWLEEDGTHYLIIANNNQRCLNVYKYVVRDKTKSHWAFDRAIDLRDYIDSGARLKALVTLPNNDLLFSCYKGSSTAAAYYIKRIMSPLGTAPTVSVWSEDTNAGFYTHDLKFSADGFVYYCCADINAYCIKKYDVNGSLVTSFGLNGVSRPSFDGTTLYPYSLYAAGDYLLVSHASSDSLQNNALGLVGSVSGQAVGSLIDSCSDTNEDGQLATGGAVWNSLYHDSNRKILFANVNGNLIKITNLASLSALSASYIDAAEIVKQHYSLPMDCHSLAVAPNRKLIAYTVTCDKVNAINSKYRQPVILGVYNCDTGEHEYINMGTQDDGLLNWGGSLTFLTADETLYLAATSYYDNCVKFFKQVPNNADVSDWSLF